MGRARARAAPSTLLSPSLPPTQLFLQAASNAALNCTQPGGTRSGSPADGGGAAASAHARYASLAPWHATRAALSTAGSSPGMRGAGAGVVCVRPRRLRDGFALYRMAPLAAARASRSLPALRRARAPTTVVRAAKPAACAPRAVRAPVLAPSSFARRAMASPVAPGE